MPGSRPFRPALIIVDLQEDFCPPNGSLAVPNGRSIIPIINDLLTFPFVLKIATKDWHPPDHISFATNHTNKNPYTDSITIVNPHSPTETYESRLWPIHCVQNTPGAELVHELEVGKLDKVIEKGQRKDVEMYSAFYDPFERPRVCDSGLAGVLRKGGVTDVFVVGLAADYCVRCTAVDAVKEGFGTWIVEEGTRAVDQEMWERKGKEEVRGLGVGVVGLEGEEVGRVRGLGGGAGGGG